MTSRQSSGYSSIGVRCRGRRCSGGGQPSVVADMIEQSVNRREPIIVKDWGDYTPLMDVLQAEGVEIPPVAIGHGRAAQCVPLFVKGVVSGALYLLHPTPGYYTEQQAGLAMAFGQQVATAIENVRLYVQARQHETELATLLEISRTVSSTLELRPLLGVILDQLKTVVDYSGAGIYLGPDADEYRCTNIVARCRAKRWSANAFHPRQPTIIRNAMARSGPVIVEDWGEHTPLMLAAAGVALPPGLESVGPRTSFAVAADYRTRSDRRSAGCRPSAARLLHRAAWPAGDGLCPAGRQRPGERPTVPGGPGQGSARGASAAGA